MTKLEEKRKELEKLKESNKSAWDSYGSELCAGDMSAKEERLEDEIKELEAKEDEAVWKMYAEPYGVKSGKAYKYLFENHMHPFGDFGEDMVTFKVALEAIKIAEKELKEKYECRKD